MPTTSRAARIESAGVAARRGVMYMWASLMSIECMPPCGIPLICMFVAAAACASGDSAVVRCACERAGAQAAAMVAANSATGKRERHKILLTNSSIAVGPSLVQHATAVVARKESLQFIGHILHPGVPIRIGSIFEKPRSVPQAGE